MIESALVAAACVLHNPAVLAFRERSDVCVNKIREKASVLSLLLWVDFCLQSKRLKV